MRLSSFPWRQTLALFCICLVCTALWAEAAQSQIADKVLRLHVLANSDSQEDQTLKLHVRDAVLAVTTPLLEGENDAARAEQLLRQNLDVISAAAEQEIFAQGYTYPVKVALEKAWFPTRQYDAVILPAGNYQALRILIGEGVGHNWWCVVFPSLCLPSVSENALEASGFSNQEVSLITENEISFRFRVLELWQNWKHWVSQQQ